MPTEWTITDAGTTVQRVLDGYIVREADGGAQRIHHSFPMEVLELRCAEYGINPADFDLLIDIVIHERFVPDPDDPANAQTDAAARAGMTAPAVTRRRGVEPLTPVPTTLWNAASRDDARAALLERINHAKTTTGNVTRASGKADPLAPLRTAWEGFADPAEIEAKRQDVETTRSQLRAAAERRAREGAPTRLRSPRPAREDGRRA